MNTTPTPTKRTIPPSLIRELKSFYKKSARAHLPWRQTRDPYKILVSEVMLQQTQVDRVIPYYERWLKEFPTARVLSMAPLSRVLKAWQGLGYNRRGKYLHEAAKIISTQGWEGKLPGVGPYTAAAVQAFAHNKPTVFIETNIRTVFFHHIYSGVLQKTSIDDRELLPLVEETLRKSKMEPRDFYAALMDYGSHLKRQGVKLNTKSKHYAKQSKFEGSARQKRAAKLRDLLAKGASEAQIRKALDSK
jgi:A/G-specific adenine glycosylase